MREPDLIRDRFPALAAIVDRETSFQLRHWRERRLERQVNAEYRSSKDHDTRDL